MHDPATRSRSPLSALQHQVSALSVSAHQTTNVPACQVLVWRGGDCVCPCGWLPSGPRAAVRRGVTTIRFYAVAAVLANRSSPSIHNPAYPANATTTRPRCPDSNLYVPIQRPSARWWPTRPIGPGHRITCLSYRLLALSVHQQSARSHRSHQTVEHPPSAAHGSTATTAFISQNVRLFALLNVPERNVTSPPPFPVPFLWLGLSRIWDCRGSSSFDEIWRVAGTLR